MAKIDLIKKDMTPLYKMSRQEVEDEIKNIWLETIPVGTVLELKQYIKDKRDRFCKEGDAKIIGLDAMLKADLLELCEHRGVPASRHTTKALMIQRLKANLSKDEKVFGSDILPFGKHKDETFEAILARDMAYTQWAVETVMENGSRGCHPEMVRFATWADEQISGSADRVDKARLIKIKEHDAAEKQKVIVKLEEKMIKKEDTEFYAIGEQSSASSASVPGKHKSMKSELEAAASAKQFEKVLQDVESLTSDQIMALAKKIGTRMDATM